jgi:hypothetical protein
MTRFLICLLIISVGFTLNFIFMKTISIPGFEKQQISVQLPDSFASSTPKLFINNQPAPDGPKKGQYVLHRDDGTEATAYFKGGFPDPIPVLMVGGQTIRLAKPFIWYQWLWVCFPLILVGLGGAVGGGLGAVAATLNARILRSQQNGVVRYTLSAVVSVAAFVIWLTIVALIRGNLGQPSK